MFIALSDKRLEVVQKVAVATSVETLNVEIKPVTIHTPYQFTIGVAACAFSHRLYLTVDNTEYTVVTGEGERNLVSFSVYGSAQYLVKYKFCFEEPDDADGTEECPKEASIYLRYNSSADAWNGILHSSRDS